ncbi:helix-turn-helix domain-containing protein [Fontisubflavum oceani]|uniref:helix-turn-helix domain-containing protein n=1 Tax=Fontisubflavum oceani TaxID=2978973 RepID=UPI0038B3D029
MLELNRVHLSGLRAVEAVGRLKGLQPAAEELGVSVGAVSQQVKKTETALGRTLFHRTPGGCSQLRRARRFWCT